ncbi:hypothetical protein B0T16DRAFT_457778 [Cercophora newfieldiana]|uniref:Uncharacterized protein n=1 Tax=Cercophora newfieldiana TaxID=92897 RepID=A0AA40CNU2_9PEZI|nr:hypothetical protein B0T16DRAFT_457778 [Cercophora newfieldiana]
MPTMVGEYRTIPLDENSRPPEPSWFHKYAKIAVLIAAGAVIIIGPFILDSLLAGAKCSLKNVMFQFPTRYEDTGPVGDGLWDSLIPVGAGFIRVPYPRNSGLPPSEPIANDTEEAEVYSLSVTHQLHCLAVLRDVIIKYEKGDKSRFAGDGHEYYCLDYIRQAILCAGYDSRLLCG